MKWMGCATEKELNDIFSRIFGKCIIQFGKVGEANAANGISYLYLCSDRYLHSIDEVVKMQFICKVT